MSAPSSTPSAVRWRLRKLRDNFEQHCEALRVAGDLDPLLAKLLCLRGVEKQQLQEVLDPKVADLFPDPSLLADLDKASDRLLAALRTGEKIGIVTDYDVDGACSASLLIQAWRAWGGECVYTVPDRFKEGYGPSDQAFQRLRSQGAEGLVLTLDCGSNAQQVLRCKQQQGWEVIVVDHHALTSSSEEAEQTEAVFAMVNPQRKDNRVDLRSLSACGVVMLLLATMRRGIQGGRDKGGRDQGGRDQGGRDQGGRDQGGRDKDAPLSFSLKPWFDVLALSSVCDVVPLSPLNRAFVRAGLAHLDAQRHAGLTALAQAAGIEPPFSTRDLAFSFGPRLNAAGRMGDPELAVELLLCVEEQDAKRALRIALTLESLNSKRRAQQEACCRKAQEAAQEWSEAQAKAHGSDAPSACFLHDDAWSIGVLGPSASRVAERLRRPMFLAAPSPVAEEATLLRGSARLPPYGWENCSLAHIVARAQAKGLLLSAGGHARACGFSLRAEQSKAFQEFLVEETRQESVDLTGGVAGKVVAKGVARVVDRVVDMELLLSAVKEGLASRLASLAPFGEGHREPLFAFREVFVEGYRLIGKRGEHVACTFSAEGGVARARVIAFGAVERGLAQALREAAETRSPRWAVGFVRPDPYKGGAQIVLEDFACLVEESA